MGEPKAQERGQAGYSQSMIRRGVLAAMVVAAAMGVTTAPAQAAPTFSAATATEVTKHGERVTYRLAMRAGPRDERFELRIRLPCYVKGCRGEPVGFVLEEVGLAKVAGPGNVLLQTSTPALAGGTCALGSLGSTDGATVNLPAATTTTLDLRYRPLRPWDNTSYRVRYEAHGGTLERRQIFYSERPKLLRKRRGVRFALRSRPAFPFFGDRYLRRGSLVRIAGTTERGLAGRKVRLRFRHAQNNTLIERAPSRALATVRVAANGRFRYRWRPFATGFYEVFATYRGDRVRTADTSCPIRFGVSER